MGRYANGLFVAVIISATLFVAGSALAAPLTVDQLQQVTNLLTTLNVDAQKIKAIEAILKGGSSDNEGVASCVILSRDFGYGTRDTAPNGEVTNLQKFLGVSPTGYFGPMTQEAVKKWQAANGVVSTGTPNTTGYGFVGPRTRAAFRRLCVNPTEQKISFTANPSTAMINTQTVNFSAYPEEGIAISRYYVDFGDGSQADLKEQTIYCITTPCPSPMVTSHVYTKPGTYTATLNRRYGCNATVSQSCITLYSEQVAKTTVTVVTNTPPSPSSSAN